MTFKEYAEQVLQQYPVRANAKENWKVYMDLMKDNVFKFPVRKLAMLYNFEYIQGYIQQGECARTCCHSTEVSLLFGALPNAKKLTFLSQIDMDTKNASSCCMNIVQV